MIETETALWEFPCKAIGGLIRSQKKFKIKINFKVGQNDGIKTSFESKLQFSVPNICRVLRLKSNSFQSIMVFFFK